MTNRELVELLMQYDPDAEVVLLCPPEPDEYGEVNTCLLMHSQEPTHGVDFENGVVRIM